MDKTKSSTKCLFFLCRSVRKERYEFKNQMVMLAKETNTSNFLYETNLFFFAWQSIVTLMKTKMNGDKYKSNIAHLIRILCDLCIGYILFYVERTIKKKKNTLRNQAKLHIHRFWQIITHVMCFSVVCIKIG